MNFNTHYTYFLILAFSLIVPLALSFDKKVNFRSHWSALFKAMQLPAIFYIVWDVLFTAKGVWMFNEKYITGIKILNLPIEEILFFLIIPYCCVFIYECVKAYLPKWNHKPFGDVLLISVGLILWLLGIYFYNKAYTSSTFIFTGLFIALLYFFKWFFSSFDATSFLVTFAIILLPFLIVNGLLTAIPVVVYNNFQNLSLRIYTIPFEDVFYGMLLILMNIVFYEKFKTKG